MSVEAVEAPTARARLTLRELAIRGVAWALVATCLVLLGTVLVAGERPASYADLRAAVADGRVDEVRVEGGLSGQVIGASSATVHWRDGLMRRVTSVTEATSRHEARDSGRRAPVIEGRVDDRLTELDPDLGVSRSSERTAYTELGGWRVPDWVDILSIVLAIGAVGLLIGGPQPWRATRWAWLWLMAVVPPLGILAFLLIGRPTGLLSPTRPSSRLTGGWAFLLAMVVNAALSAVAAAIL